MRFLPLIERKRDGGRLAPAEIQEVVAAFTAGLIPDYQMAAFLMAVFFRGLDTPETTALTLAMRDSGDRLQFPADPRPLADKHSTGGVGDKVSLPLAPLLACLGFRVPMLSGRGLGITGGTLDKLDAIPGFQTLLPADRIVAITQEVGCIICGQTDRIAPADKVIYALRDASGTVPSIPLIVASILSKKLAESLGSLVLDVKWGAAAFTPGLAQARELARAMVDLGNQCGVRTRALLTRMETPLGRAAGNWVEVREAVTWLDGWAAGGEPRGLEDLTEVTLACACQLLVQTGRAPDLASAREMAVACLNSGGPRRKWDQMLAAQGADLDACSRLLAAASLAPVVVELTAPHQGFVTACNARIIGEVVRELGGGRLGREDRIDPTVGVDGLAKPGDAVAAGDRLARIHARDEASAAAARGVLAGVFTIGDEAGRPTGVVTEVVD